MSNELIRAREIISQVDREMAKLFVKRMEAARIIAEYKASHGLEILDEAREAKVIADGSAMVESDELRSYYVNFLKNTMAVSRSYQSKLMEGMRIAYCGTEGAFAHIAACQLFPDGRKIGFSSFEEAYRAVVDGICEVAVLPIENSYQIGRASCRERVFAGV